MSRTCAADGCEATIGDDKLLCYRHWSKLPDGVRLELTSAWRFRGRRGARRLLAARRAAISAANATQETVCRCGHGSSHHTPTSPTALGAPCRSCSCMDYNGPGVPTGRRS